MDHNVSWPDVPLAALCMLLPLVAGACGRTPDGTPGLKSMAGPVGNVLDSSPPPATDSALGLTQPVPEKTLEAKMQTRRATAAAVGLLTPVTAVNMVTYSNAMLGLSFAYPAELGEVVFDVYSIPRGSSNCCAWNLWFSRFDGLVFGGGSVDLDDNLPYTLGFIRGEDGGYLQLSTAWPEGQLVDVSEVLRADGHDLLLYEPPQYFEVEEPSVVALVNLAGDRFPGLSVGATTRRLPLDTFRQMLSTIRVWPPTQAVQTSEPRAIPPNW